MTKEEDTPKEQSDQPDDPGLAAPNESKKPESVDRADNQPENESAPATEQAADAPASPTEPEGQPFTPQQQKVIAIIGALALMLGLFANVAQVTTEAGWVGGIIALLVSAALVIGYLGMKSLKLRIALAIAVLALALLIAVVSHALPSLSPDDTPSGSQSNSGRALEVVPVPLADPEVILSYKLKNDTFVVFSWQIHQPPHRNKSRFLIKKLPNQGTPRHDEYRVLGEIPGKPIPFDFTNKTLGNVHTIQVFEVDAKCADKIRPPDQDKVLTDRLCDTSQAEPISNGFQITLVKKK